MHAPNPKFFKKSNFPLPFLAAGIFNKKNWFRTEPTGSGKKKKTVPYGTGQGRFDEAVRTGRGPEPVGPADFIGSCSILVTLHLTL
jgi:hypothetical protein